MAFWFGAVGNQEEASSVSQRSSVPLRRDDKVKHCADRRYHIGEGKRRFWSLMLTETHTKSKRSCFLCIISCYCCGPVFNCCFHLGSLALCMLCKNVYGSATLPCIKAPTPSLLNCWNGKLRYVACQYWAHLRNSILLHGAPYEACAGLKQHVIYVYVTCGVCGKEYG